MPAHVPTCTYTQATATKYSLVKSFHAHVSRIGIEPCVCSTPYNIDLSWDVIATAGRMESIEIFLNFMVMDMNMNVLLRDPEKEDAAQVTRMTRFWADES